MGIGWQTLALMSNFILDGRMKNISSVIELGSQDIYATETDVLNFFNVTGAEYKTADVSLSFRGDRPSARLVYQGIGVNDYQSIDIDGRHNSLHFDLNSDIRTQNNYTAQFDLVTNHGTSEHILNQYAVFLNIHNLCKTGGLMFHGLPMHGYHNHGFFNYHPIFFETLARSNNYHLDGIWINIDQEYGIPFFEYTDENIAAMMRNIVFDLTTTRIHLWVLLRKLNDSEFRMPFHA